MRKPKIRQMWAEAGLSAALATALAVCGAAAQDRPAEVLPAADRSVQLGEFVAAVPLECAPTANRSGRTSALHCEWAARDGTTRIYDLKVTTNRNHATLSQLGGLSAESQRIMLSAGLPAYLNTQLELGLPREISPPQGFTLRKVTHGGYPAPGPGGMLGWCTSVGYQATSGAEMLDALGLACVVVAANRRDLLEVGSVLGTRHKSGGKPPAGFAREAERIAGSLRHRK